MTELTELLFSGQLCISIFPVSVVSAFGRRRLRESCTSYFRC